MGKALMVVVNLFSSLTLAAAAVGSLEFQSPFLRVKASKEQPSIEVLSVDSLGKSKLAVNPLRPAPLLGGAFQVQQKGQFIEYRWEGRSSATPPVWAFQFSAKEIHLRSTYANNPLPPLVLTFDPHINHATLLGLTNEDGSVRLPALLHLPDMGTFRITGSSPDGLALGYDALRFPQEQHDKDYVRVTFPPATPDRPVIEYTLDVVAIYPERPELAGDPRFDGFRRNWLNIFQLNPRLRVLANHAASDPCAFTVFMYSSMAIETPNLAPGLTALDLIRQTLDRYLHGMKAYGMAGYTPNDPTTRYDYLDTYPSLLIAARDYVCGSKDTVWLEKNYAGLKGWAARIFAMDHSGSGLIEYPASGNSGTWTNGEAILLRPANWWDTIGFGHQDAYSNALAYHALEGMAAMAREADRSDDAQFYASRAEKIRSVYYDTFYGPDTGVLAGWKSADGKLHDYYFLFVNGAAITYGLVPLGKANLIMDRLLAKLHSVGYSNFQYGLPGNLIPIRRDDYVDLDPRYGGPRKEDGADGFQIYENGGATACYAYFTLEALYKLGRGKEADAILFPMLDAFERGGFQGRGLNGMTYDWKAWDGTPHGYEGLLVDGYQTLLAVLSR
jgi:Bacterial alpha-L-rhamnosidase 6 hairpin glycosidase domain